MTLITWTQEQFGTTVAQHDEEHQQLFKLLNDLHYRIGNSGRYAIGAALDNLIAFVAEHFSSEERNMAAAGYPGLEDHKLEHDKLVQLCLDLQHSFHAGAVEVTEQTTAFLRDWLSDHIPRVDFEYGPSLAAGSRQ